MKAPDTSPARRVLSITLGLLLLAFLFLRVPRHTEIGTKEPVRTSPPPAPILVSKREPPRRPASSPPLSRRPALRLVAPEPDAELPLAESALELAWTLVAPQSAAFTIEISRDPGFQRFASLETTASRLRLDVLHAGDYYWRVRARIASRGLVSERRHFHVSNPAR
jgi:hypothetical protein